LGNRDPEQTGGGQLGPQGAIETGGVGVLDRAQLVVRAVVGQHFAGEVADRDLLVGESEVHGCLSPYRFAIGMPRPNTEIRSRWISFTPPPKVRMVSARYICSSRERSTDPGASRLTYDASPTISISNRATSR